SGSNDGSRQVGDVRQLSARSNRISWLRGHLPTLAQPTLFAREVCARAGPTSRLCLSASAFGVAEGDAVTERELLLCLGEDGGPQSQAAGKEARALLVAGAGAGMAEVGVSGCEFARSADGQVGLEDAVDALLVERVEGGVTDAICVAAAFCVAPAPAREGELPERDRLRVVGARVAERGGSA